MEYKTEQERFWAEEFGDEYCKRNTSIIKSNINFFSKVFNRVKNVNSVIEFGSNIGMNLHALNKIFDLELSAIEINKTAVKQLEKLDFIKNIYNESLLEINLNEKFDMTFIKGVLIHINPKYLDIVYEKLYTYSNRYILIAEYYNPTPVEVPYRGFESKLFKRDFAGEILDKFDDLNLVDYGFLYHRDNNFPQDDISWFLLEKKMNIYIVIQARTTSTRLPKKVLLPLGSKTVLEVMIKRLEKFKENLIIATTNDGTQEEIVNICKKHNIKYYEGDTNNVLSRYYEACKKFNLKDDDIVIRCTSDCPFVDAKLIQKAINLYKTSKADYVSLGVHSGFPRGLDTEVFSFKLLTQAYNNATTDYEKEHVTIYMHTTIKDKLKIDFLKSFEDNSKYRITLDEIADYEAIKKLYEKLGNKEEFSYEKLISTLKDNPEIFEINKFVEQKKR